MSDERELAKEWSADDEITRLTARVAELEGVVNEALTKVENDRTMWNEEWLVWAQDARAAITKGEGKG